MAYILEWSREMLLEMWMKDPLLCCEKARIRPPTSALQFMSQMPSENTSCKKRSRTLPPVITTAIVAQEYQLCQSLNSPVRTSSYEEEIIVCVFFDKLCFPSIFCPHFVLVCSARYAR